MKKIDTTITTQRCVEHLKKSDERTASSYPRLNLGHCEAHTLLEELAAIKFLVVNLSIENRQHLDRWLCGVSLMLEKQPGKIDVQKLRDILSLEADFNSNHRLIFNGRLMPRLEEENLI